MLCGWSYMWDISLAHIKDLPILTLVSSVVHKCFYECVYGNRSLHICSVCVCVHTQASVCASVCVCHLLGCLYSGTSHTEMYIQVELVVY